MSKKLYTAVSGKTHKVKKLYAAVNGKTHKVKKLYAVVNGKTKLIYDSSADGPASGIVDAYLISGLLSNQTSVAGNNRILYLYTNPSDKNEGATRLYGQNTILDSVKSYRFSSNGKIGIGIQSNSATGIHFVYSADGITYIGGTNNLMADIRDRYTSDGISYKTTTLQSLKLSANGDKALLMVYVYNYATNFYEKWLDVYLYDINGSEFVYNKKVLEKVHYKAATTASNCTMSSFQMTADDSLSLIGISTYNATRCSLYQWNGSSYDRIFYDEGTWRINTPNAITRDGKYFICVRVNDTVKEINIYKVSNGTVTLLGNVSGVSNEFENFYYNPGNGILSNGHLFYKLSDTGITKLGTFNGDYLGNFGISSYSDGTYHIKGIIEPYSGSWTVGWFTEEGNSLRTMILNVLSRNDMNVVTGGVRRRELYSTYLMPTYIDFNLINPENF